MVGIDCEEVFARALLKDSQKVGICTRGIFSSFKKFYNMEKYRYGSTCIHNLLNIVMDTSKKFEETENDFALSYTLCSLIFCMI